jgi:hypothetical protein
MARQRSFQFRAVKNSGFLSSHWLENRLRLEPEWTHHEPAASAALRELSRIWEVQRPRVASYGNEAALEQAFIEAQALERRLAQMQ